MAKKPTGRAASIARNNERKTKLKESGVKTVVAGAPKGAVAGATTGPSDAIKNLSIGLATGTGGSARGDDFSGGYSSGADKSPVDTTPRSKSELKNATFGLAGGGGISDAARRAADLAKARQEAKDRKAKRESLRSGGLLASDNLRASNLDKTQDEAITTKGGRSTMSGRDENQRTGAGTIDNPLTDIQIKDLEEQGIMEGDLVPGKGFLTPLGTFQSEYERKAQDLTKQATDLASKDTSPTDNITSSDETIVNEEKSATDTINESAKVVRDLTYLDDEIKRIQDELKDEIKSIEAQAKVDKATLQDTQSSETGQTSMMLANAGGYLGMSGSATGVLLNLAKSHRSELQSLDAERQQAIFEAQEAARENRFDIVKLKAQELKDIEQEEYNRKQDYLAETRRINEKEAEKKEKVATQNSIYNAISTGSKTVEDIFNKLGGEVDIATIKSFLEDVTPEGSEGFKFSATQNASLLGSGMSMDDIRATSEYISANGYDETIKSALTPSQRAAVDKIFKSGAIGTGNGTNFTDQEQRKLEQAGLLTAPRQEQLDYLYGADEGDLPYESVYTSQILEDSTTLDSLPLEVQDDVRAELLNLGFGSDVVPEWYKDYVEASSNQTLTADSLKSNWSSYRKKGLGESTTAADKPWWKFGS